MQTMRDRIPVCKHGAREMIDQSLILSLERLEKEMQTEFTFRSGYRCEKCNTRAGGVKNSAHLRGKAVDILADNSAERYALVRHALHFNFSRLGIGKNFIHLDVDLTLPQQMMWLY